MSEQCMKCKFQSWLWIFMTSPPSPTFKNGPTPGYFVYFRFFRHKLHRKSAGFTRIRIWIVRVEGEPADNLTATTAWLYLPTFAQLIVLTPWRDQLKCDTSRQLDCKLWQQKLARGWGCQKPSQRQRRGNNFTSNLKCSNGVTNNWVRTDWVKFLRVYLVFD